MVAQKANFNCFNEDLQAAVFSEPLGIGRNIYIVCLAEEKYCCLHKKPLTVFGSREDSAPHALLKNCLIELYVKELKVLGAIHAYHTFQPSWLN